MNRDTFERIAGLVFFTAFMAVQFTLGITAAIRVLGLECIVTGAVWVFGRSIPVGVEDRSPSFFLRGAGAVIVGVAMGALGVAFLFYGTQAACLLGWASEQQCM